MRWGAHKGRFRRTLGYCLRRWRAAMSHSTAFTCQRRGKHQRRLRSRERSRTKSRIVRIVSTNEVIVFLDLEAGHFPTNCARVAQTLRPQKNFKPRHATNSRRGKPPSAHFGCRVYTHATALVTCTAGLPGSFLGSFVSIQASALSSQHSVL